MQRYSSIIRRPLRSTLEVMPPCARPAAVCLFLLLLTACTSGNNGASSRFTDVPETTGVSGSQSAVPGLPGHNGGLPPEGAWDDDAVWLDFFDGDIARRIQDECAPLPAVECLIAIAEDSHAGAAVIRFMQRYDATLLLRQPHGRVDFGMVVAPPVNMGRAMPVFLNGDFGLLYLSELVPHDWQSQPDYAVYSPMALAWPEYVEIIQVLDDGAGQDFRVQLPIRDCRACQDRGGLNLSVAFDSSGSLRGVRVLLPSPAD